MCCPAAGLCAGQGVLCRRAGHAAKNEKHGFAEDAWIPYLTIRFKLTKEGSTFKKTGTLAPMTAEDGPHYANNVRMAGPGTYDLTYEILPPSSNAFIRHIDKATGWRARVVEADHRALDLHISEQGEGLMACCMASARVAVGLLVIAGACLFSASWVHAQTAIDVTIKDHRFSPSEIRVPAGKPAILNLKNKDTTAEEFDSTALKIEKVIAGGKEGTVRLRPLDPGRYPFMGEYHSDTAQGVVIAE